MLTFPILNRRRPREPKQITAFGKTKTVAEWLADPFFPITREALLKRLERGWSAETALGRPVRRRLSLKGGRSQYRGVCFHRGRGRWMAKIYHEGRTLTIGYFTTQLDAARAFDRKAKQLRGPDAWVNFAEEQTSPARR